jgi:hypothetical protein
MAFTTYAYISDSEDSFRIKLTAETAAAGGFTDTTGLSSQSPYVKVSKGNREFGLRPRGVRLSREAIGTVSRFLPVATNDQVESLVSQGTVTIGGETWTVTSAQPEDR